MKARRKIAGQNWEFDGSTITVHIPVAWKRRGGCKVIIAPDGGDAWVPANPRPDETLMEPWRGRIGGRGCLRMASIDRRANSPKQMVSPAASSTGCYG
jgi:hypothetical protein